MKVISGFISVTNALAVAADATNCLDAIPCCTVPKPTHTRFNPVTGIEVEISLLALILTAPYLPLVQSHSAACSQLMLVRADSNRAPALPLACAECS
jgi:hypothetical protein